MKRNTSIISILAVGLLVGLAVFEGNDAHAGSDSQGRSSVVVANCSSWQQASDTVGTGAAISFPNAGTAHLAASSLPNFLPAGSATLVTNQKQLVGRKYITICVSRRTATATALVNVRVDGSAPTAATSDPGTVLGVGDCVQFPINELTVPQIISDTASTFVTSFECN